jgi:5'-nucleotidase
MSGRLLLTNDDGIDEPGLQALVRAAGVRGRAWIVAPDGPRSGCGHAVTTHGAIEVQRRDGGHIAVAGTPADCVRIGLMEAVGEVDWVLAGINPGGNLGTDIHHSGTVAAVREATLHGVPAVAVSHYIARGRLIDWARAERWTARVLERIFEQEQIAGTFWNVNLPHLAPGDREPRVVFCAVDPSPLPLGFRNEDGRIHYAGDYHARRRVDGGDVATCFGGDISVSRVLLTPGTHHHGLAGWELDTA